MSVRRRHRKVQWSKSSRDVPDAERGSGRRSNRNVLAHSPTRRTAHLHGTSQAQTATLARYGLEVRRHQARSHRLPVQSAVAVGVASLPLLIGMLVSASGRVGTAPLSW